MDNTTLYRLDTRGKIRSWYIENRTYTLDIYTGLLNGAKVHTEIDIVTNMSGRNQEEQSWFEYDSRIAKQLRLGYSETIEEARKGRKFEAMKGHRYQDHRDKVDFVDWWLQPKLDGFRCTSHKIDGIVTLWTYGRKEIITLPHVVTELSIHQPDNSIWDGELYVHGVKLQTIRKWALTPQANSHRIEYHIYDDATPDNFTFNERYTQLCVDIPEDNKVLKSVTTLPVTSHENAVSLHNHFATLGYEGVVLRKGNSLYVNTKGYFALKFKVLEDDEFIIVDVVAPTKGSDRGCAIFVMELNDGSGLTFKAINKGITKAQRRRQYRNKTQYIGKQATVEYAGLSEDSIPVPNPVIKQIDRHSIGDL